MPPGLTALLDEVPTHQRTGLVFDIRHRAGRYKSKQVGRVISRIGEKACIVINEEGKSASAHDIRRRFGQRVANAGVPPRYLKTIMRHRSIRTIEKFYLQNDAKDLGSRLREKLGTPVPNFLLGTPTIATSDSNNGSGVENPLIK